MLINCFPNLTFEVEPLKEEYATNGNLSISLWITEGEDKGEYFGSLTVNLGEKLPVNQAYVDTSNTPDAERFIRENGLGRPLGKYRQQGRNTYPLYEFYEKELEKPTVMNCIAAYEELSCSEKATVKTEGAVGKLLCEIAGDKYRSWETCENPIIETIESLTDAERAAFLDGCEEIRRKF